ncbi:DUF3618 domain-containing protein [Streptomyces sp. NPDC002088]|uniref:DUF3618 domain-containing protein n=1 Tax=Streptomyces sp. NPDC002088 TaxID=3154665 RepID=UPI003318DCDE
MTTGRTAQGAAGAKGPDGLRRQIERTRSQLGDTVHELAAKVDVKGRAKARVADLGDRVGAMTVQLRSSAAQAGQGVQDTAVHAGHGLQDTAAWAGHSLQDTAARAGHSLHDTATRAGRSAEHVLPGPFRRAVRAGRRHPRPVLIVGAAGAAIVAAGVLRRRHDGR